LGLAALRDSASPNLCLTAAGEIAINRALLNRP
jgi:hypothetical protein